MGQAGPSMVGIADDLLVVASRARVAALRAQLEAREQAPVRVIETYVSWVVLAAPMATESRRLDADWPKRCRSARRIREFGLEPSGSLYQATCATDRFGAAYLAVAMSLMGQFGSSNAELRS